MTQQKRKPVFQESGSDTPVHIDPPLKSVDEFDDLVGDDAPEPVEPQKNPADPETEIEPLPPKNGWQVIGVSQQTGKIYFVTHNSEIDGARAFWRKTRKLNHFRWVLRGVWSDPMTGSDLIPQPIYFKEIN